MAAPPRPGCGPSRGTRGRCLKRGRGRRLGPAGTEQLPAPCAHRPRRCWLGPRRAGNALYSFSTKTDRPLPRLPLAGALNLSMGRDPETPPAVPLRLGARVHRPRAAVPRVKRCCLCAPSVCAEAGVGWTGESPRPRRGVRGCERGWCCPRAAAATSCRAPGSPQTSGPGRCSADGDGAVWAARCGDRPPSAAPRSCCQAAPELFVPPVAFPGVRAARGVCCPSRRWGLLWTDPPQCAGAGGGCGTVTGVCRTQRVLAPIWGSLLLVVSCLLARPDWSSRCSRAGTTSGTGWQRSSELHPQPQPHQPRLSLSWKSVSQCRRCYRLPTCGSILHLPGSLCPTSGSRAGIVTPQSCPGMRAHCGAHRTRDHQRGAGGLWDHV